MDRLIETTHRRDGVTAGGKLPPNPIPALMRDGVTGG